ncbi:MAG: beta propeller repeat protein [Candidatus Dormibacteria bacterium]
MRARAVAAAAAALMAALSPLPAHASAWWEPLALTGHDVSSVGVAAHALYATVDGIRMVSLDGGASFQPAPAAAVIVPAGGVTAAGITWTIAGGHVLAGRSPSTLRPDPGAPFLGAGASLIAAPGAVPGLVLAVGTDGHVWRRSPAGAWTTALVLLPAGGLAGPPRVTGLQAFTEPLSAAVYLATDGEGVLLTTDGGADWIRTDGAGLPETISAIAASNATRSLYAATPDGLWVHHLQAPPRPPVYADASLWWRWLGVAAVAAAASLAAVAGLRRLLVTDRLGS